MKDPRPGTSLGRAPGSLDGSSGKAEIQVPVSDRGKDRPGNRGSAEFEGLRGWTTDRREVGVESILRRGRGTLGRDAAERRNLGPGRIRNRGG